MLLGLAPPMTPTSGNRLEMDRWHAFLVALVFVTLFLPVIVPANTGMIKVTLGVVFNGVIPIKVGTAN